MKSAKHYFESLFLKLASRVDIIVGKSFFSPSTELYNIFFRHKKTSYIVGQSLFVIILTVGMGIIVTKHSVKAHSESDVMYKQESIFSGAGLSATAQDSEPEINPNPPGIDDTIKPVKMSFEVDKVTPTPTPAINPADNDIWLQLAECESHQNWRSDTGNGYYGGLQFSLGAWASVGGQGKPSDASSDEQIAKGKLLQQRRGWSAWGGCSKKLGLI